MHGASVPSDESPGYGTLRVHKVPMGLPPIGRRGTMRVSTYAMNRVMQAMYRYRGYDRLRTIPT